MRRLVFLQVLFAVVLFSSSAFAFAGPAPAENPGGESPDVTPPPPNAQIIKVTAQQFNYIPDPIRVKKGVPVRLIITSADVPHGFVIDEFNINERIEKGVITILDFTPDKAGTYDMYCNVECGVGHSYMRGKFIVK